MAKHFDQEMRVAAGKNVCIRGGEGFYVRSDVQGLPVKDDVVTKAITNYVAGNWVATKRSLVVITENCLHILHSWYVQQLVVPNQPWAPWTRHIYRELNKDADALSRIYKNKLRVHKPLRLWSPVDFQAIRGSFDGSVQGDQVGYGWVIYVTSETSFIDAPDRWDRTLSASGVLPSGTTVAEAECMPARSLIVAIEGVLRGTVEDLRGGLLPRGT